MGQLFGTDGVRGIPGQYPLVPAFVRKLGFVTAALLREELHARGLNGEPPLILVGRDSRASGLSLGRSLVHGFSKAGCITADLGVLPTPALSFLTPRRGAMCGAMISASHNPAEFNGIKFFTADGFKMGPSAEEEIERRLLAARDPGASASTAAGLVEAPGAAAQYLDFLRSTFPADLDLCGLRLVVDCANGAAAAFAPRLFRSLGAEVLPIGCSPDGANINKGFGALDTAAMRREVLRRKAGCGVSFDGDADRAIFADETGAVCDGDALIGLCALDLQARGALRGRKVVLTIMSNFGLLDHLRRHGIEVVSVPVGDRNVTEAIERERLSLGGENSGHIVFRRFSPTGDGMLTALQVLAVLARSGKPLSRYRSCYRGFPQLLLNVRVERKIPLERLARTRAAIHAAEGLLRGRGRVLVRYSGTEPLVRVLVEGPSLGLVRSLARKIVAAFQQETRAAGPDPDDEVQSHASRYGG